MCMKEKLGEKNASSHSISGKIMQSNCNVKTKGSWKIGMEKRPSLDLRMTYNV